METRELRYFVLMELLASHETRGREEGRESEVQTEQIFYREIMIELIVV